MIECPDCGTRMEKRKRRERLYDCPRCGRVTHEKVEENRQEIRELSRTDLPIADVCKTLLGDDE